MAITVTHAFTSNIADDPKAAAAGEVLPSHWNAAHVVTGGSGRTLLTQNTNYYISSTGSDSNGGTNSTTDAWATLQHAMNFIAANLDFAGFLVTVNVGAGTFTGFGFKSCLGGGILWFKGAGSGSTIINQGPTDGTYNNGECIGVYVNADTILAANAVNLKALSPLSGGNGCLANVSLTKVILGDPTEARLSSVNADIIFSNDASWTGPFGMDCEGDSITYLYGGNYTINRTGAAAGINTEWILDSAGNIILETCHFTITGSPNYTGGFAQVFDDGMIYNEKATDFTGAVTGNSYQIYAGSVEGIALPGNGSGTLGGGGRYL